MQVTIQQNPCLQSTASVPQSNQISIAITNGNSLQRQHSQTYGRCDQSLQQNNISNNQPSLLQQALISPQQPLYFTPPQHRQIFNNEFNPQLNDSNRCQVPMNITIHQISTPNMTWMPPQQQQQ